MDILHLAAILLTLAALFGYVNHRFIGLPTTIGILVISILGSLAVVGAGLVGLTGARDFAVSLIRDLDFSGALMQGMLSFLLFAGALHVDLAELARHKIIIGVLATFGVVASTFMVGGAAYYVLGSMLDLGLPLITCLLFGSLIAPTDPVAVIGILKTVGVSKSLETKIAGESLFNDGVALVVFLVLLGISTGGTEVSAGQISLLFAKEAIGGVVFGLVIGALAFYMLRGVDNYQVEVLITLALVMGGYALAAAIHVSGPLAIVVAGLLIGNHGRLFAMSEQTREHLDAFWELVDEILNAVLFLMIGLEVLALPRDFDPLLGGALMVPVVLAARLISVAVPVTVLRLVREFSPNVIKLLTWGGLRGGISVALVLSLPAGRSREVLLAVTYVIVVFSIVVQGLTLKRLVVGAESSEDGAP